MRLPELDAAIDTDADIVGEFDDDEIEDDLPRIQRERESESADPRIIDVEIESLGPAHYTDEIMSDDPAPLHRTSQILRSVGRSARRILAIRSNGTGGVGVDVIVGRG